MTSVNQFQLWSNSLTGTIPSELSMMTSLENFILSDNSLTGTIPAELSTMTSISEIGLNDNSLTGVVPAHFVRCGAFDLRPCSQRHEWFLVHIGL